MRRGAEIDLIQRCLQAFTETTGLRLEIHRGEHRHGEDARFDAVVCLRADGIEKHFVVEAKRILTTTTLGAVLHHLTTYAEHAKILLLTEYVNPRMAERLRAANVFFIDTVGNAYLNEPPVFVFTKGNRPREKPAGARQTRAFQATGLRVVFAFLCKPALVMAPYRHIAQAAGVAVGTVGWVITDLKEAGLLVGKGAKARRLLDRTELLRRWVAAYPDKLRPRQVVGRYTAKDKDWWRHTHLTEFLAYWGGEVAAAKLTRYLRPEHVTVYVRQRPAKLQVKHGLRDNPRGEIEILKAFWNEKCDWREPDVVHPILVYADLLATAEPRNLETAKILYEQEIVGLIRQV